MDPLMTFAEQLKKIRTDNNLTLREFAAKMGLPKQQSSIQYVSNMERGLCHLPPSRLRRLCKGMGLNGYRELAESICEEKNQKQRKKWGI